MRRKSILFVLAPAALILQMGTAFAAECGTASFSRPISYPGQPSGLYYNITGAPANTCGALWADRNGSGFVLNASGWICTNSSGAATKGPWTSNPDDETAYVYIDWGTCTSPVKKHIWDVGPPSVTIGSGYPSTFSGTATDEAWGAGFLYSGSGCEVEYYDWTTGLWWSSSTGAYTATYPPLVRCSFSGTPSLNVTWSTNTAQRPELSDLVPGHTYTWKVWVTDGGQWRSASVMFTY